jgi:hypothetical protein
MSKGGPINNGAILKTEHWTGLEFKTSIKMEPKISVSSNHTKLRMGLSEEPENKNRSIGPKNVYI